MTNTPTNLADIDQADRPKRGQFDVCLVGCPRCRRCGGIRFGNATGWKRDGDQRAKYHSCTACGHRQKLIQQLGDSEYLLEY